MKEQDNNLTKSIITIILLVIALIIISILYLRTSANSEEVTFENRASEFCNQENVDPVEICNNQVIEVKSDSLGGGSTYHHRDGTSFSCQVIAPEAMSPTCKAIFDAQQTNQWNCVSVC